MSAADLNPLGVPAHRHINPDGTAGGWVADTATVAAKAHIGEYARVYGGTIRGGTIRGGTIWGGTIRGGTIWGGTIRGGTIRGGTIDGGTIRGGTIDGGTIEGGTIEGGTIRGGTIWGGTIWGGTILSSRHVLTVGPVGSEDQWLTLTRTDTGHRVTIGCWNGEHTIDDIPAEVQARCPEHADEYAELLPVLARRIAEWDTERATPAGSDRGTEG